MKRCISKGRRSGYSLKWLRCGAKVASATRSHGLSCQGILSFKNRSYRSHSFQRLGSSSAVRVIQNSSSSLRSRVWTRGGR